MDHVLLFLKLKDVCVHVYMYVHVCMCVYKIEAQLGILLYDSPANSIKTESLPNLELMVFRGCVLCHPVSTSHIAGAAGI